MLTPWKESYDQLKQHTKKQRHYFANKGQSSQGYGFFSSDVWMWELNYKESWATKNWCFWTVVLEKTLESPLDCKEINPVHPKGDQSWVFIGRTDVEAETAILWPPDVKSWLIGKDPDAGRDWGQEEKGMTEDETVGWHHWLNRHGFGWAPGVGDGQGGLEKSWTWLRDWTELNTWLRRCGFQSKLCDLQITCPWHKNWVSKAQFLQTPNGNSFTFVVVQSLSGVWLFETPWNAACQASLSFTVSWNLLILMSIESMMSSNHLLLCCSHLFLPSIFLSIKVFSNESPLLIRWPRTGASASHQHFQWVFRVYFL